MHLFLWAEDSEAELRSELALSFPGAPVRSAEPSLLETDFDLVAGQRLPHVAFARQWLPQARAVRAESIREWAGLLFEGIVAAVPEDQAWSLHVEPHYGTRTIHRLGARAWHSASRIHGSHPAGCASPRALIPRHAWARGDARPPEQSAPDADAGGHRCRLIREAVLELLQRQRRQLLRQLRRDPVPFAENESLVQLLLTAPDAGFISMARAPLPFEQRHLLSPFPKGEVAIASDKAAPSRAFAKLLEAELRLGRAIKAGESCVDLGAAPGSWTYVAANRGARVMAVDRSPLREDVRRNRRVEFHQGDAFSFEPPRPVDWLLCDVIAAPERTAALLREWLQRRWCQRFVVTVKLKDAPGADTLAQLKRELPPLTRELFLTRLCANKREVCAFGSVA
jgi:23S rRNA (cytidine2498-2'-O)-methyltransferase